MIVTVDRRGRIVIPKPLRIALGIGPDTLVGYAARCDGRVLLTRDRRAERTYRSLGLGYEFVD